jgi:hypothetical protein
MDAGLWIGLLLSIPISILVNLFTPKIQAWLDSRNRKRSLIRTKYLQQEYEQVRYYRENRGEFREYLIWIVIRTTFVGSLVGIFAAFVFVIPNFFEILNLEYEQTRIIRHVLYIAGQLISLIGALLIVNICSNALKVYFRVRDFDIYEESVKKNLSAGAGGELPIDTETNTEAVGRH